MYQTHVQAQIHVLVYLSEFVYVAFYFTESLRCYKCEPCSDPFKANNVANLTIVNCNGTCLKAVTEFHDLGLCKYKLVALWFDTY